MELIFVPSHGGTTLARQSRAAMLFLNSPNSDLASRTSEERVEPYFQYKSEYALIADGRTLGLRATRRNVSRSKVAKA